MMFAGLASYQWHSRGSRVVVLTLGSLLLFWNAEPSATLRPRQGDEARRLTPLQLEIEKQRHRLNALEVEERRDALMRLAALEHPAASRAAVPALNDQVPIVRATASSAVLWLPAEESAASLIPLLNDRDEFVRQEVAYALGRTGSRSAVQPLIERLAADKKPGVRGAAAVALGQICDESAVASLSQVLLGQVVSADSKKTRTRKSERNVFVLRAAARSLGQIASTQGLPALLAALKNDKAADDVRREAATALGMIADPSAAPALSEVLTAQDAYLSQAAHDALLKISRAGTGGRR